jgi:hypothetical protein
MGEAMPRGDDWDDDEDDRPRRRRQRPRYDDDEDDDYDYDIRRRGGAAKSGAVTGVGVMSIILGCLDLLVGVCVLLVALVVGDAGNRAGGFAVPGFGGAVAAMVIATLLLLLWGTLALISGIGVLNRRQWARIMVLVLSGIGAAAGLLFLVGAFGALGAGVDAAGNRGPGFMGFLINLFLAAILIGYCVWSYVVLLNGRNGAEFS